jgi:hypothetical protein
MLFIQNGTAWNTIQFFYYSLVFLGVLAGIGFSRILQTSKVILRGGLIFVVLTLTLPTMVATLRNYLPARPPAMLSKNELSALNFLAHQPDGIVLTQPFDREASEKVADIPPRPLYLYESTAYVSALSNKAVYLEDEVNLEITRYDWKNRKEELIDVLGNDRSDYLAFIHKYNISYIYMNKDSSYNINPYSIGDKVFEDSQVTIFRVD